MTAKITSIGDYKIETLTEIEVKDIIAMLRQAQQDNLDDEYSYDYFKKLASKIYRMGLAFQSLWYEGHKELLGNRIHLLCEENLDIAGTHQTEGH